MAIETDKVYNMSKKYRRFKIIVGKTVTIKKMAVKIFTMVKMAVKNQENVC